MSTRGSTIVADYIKEQLDREDQRKASIEARGVAVVTTSGVLATLLLGLATLSDKNQTSEGVFTIPEPAQEWLRAALVFFTLAALAALVTNIPVWLQWANISGLRDALTDPSTTAADAEKDIAENRIDILAALRRGNNVKGWVLFGAGVCQVVAVGCLAIGVWVAL